MSPDAASSSELRVLLSAEQIRKRVREMASQIAADYRGKAIYAVCVMENGFVFMADLIRQIPGEMVCQFVRPDLREITQGAGIKMEIFFGPEPDVKGCHVLLVEGLVHSGITTEFLMRHLMGRGAASVKLATLLDREGARRVSLQPDYCGFQLTGEMQVCGYGLGAPQRGRNLPYIAVAGQAPHIAGA
ncbi:MAG: phosphoribosyltransferase [Terriglobales bacterium]